MDQVRKLRGLTLIETLVCLIIIGIVTALALPSYSDIVERTRRANIQLTLFELHMQQQRFHLIHGRYAKDGELLLPHSNHYSLGVANVGTNTFELIAKSKMRLHQTTSCNELKIDDQLVKTPLACW